MLPLEKRMFSTVLQLLVFIVSRSVSGHVRTHQLGRHLDETDDTTFMFNDLSTYSIRYQKCQSIKMFDDELAASQQSQSASSPLATRHFVVFRMCPSSLCISGCAPDTSPYGTYALPVKDYLSYTVKYQKQELEQSCAFCNAYCLQDDGQSYCTSYCSNSLCTNCASLCDEYNRYNTAIANGNAMIADAADFIQCQQVAAQNDDAADQNENSGYYIGPYCQTLDTKSSKQSIATTPTQVVIGVFSDANCYDPVFDVNVTQVLNGVQLSYHFLKHTSTASSNSANSNPLLPPCLSCLEGDQNQNDANDLDDVNEMCENVYQLSAKCETPTGLSSGFIQMNREGGENDNQKTTNQVENEFMACTFIDSIVLNSYTETGIINLSVPQDFVGRYVTPTQRNTFLFLFACIGACVGLMVYYQRRIKDVQTGGTAAAASGENAKALLIQKGEIS
jgi:hypothetical protein